MQQSNPHANVKQETLSWFLASGSEATQKMVAAKKSAIPFFGGQTFSRCFICLLTEFF